MASAGASGKSTVTPSANRLLQRKWDERKYREHQDRVRSVSYDNYVATADNKPLT